MQKQLIIKVLYFNNFPGAALKDLGKFSDAIMMYDYAI